jgi:4-hydroxy-tetrahydrodipicolinate synthase
MSILNNFLYTACITPFIGNEIDFESFEKNLRLQDNARNGVLILGSTGESLALSLEERMKIVRFVIELELKTQIMIGIPSINLEQSLEWVKFCESMSQKSFDGYLLSSPLYTKPGIIGQTKWFETIMSESKRDFMLYNIPGRTGVKLFPEILTNLSHFKNLVALKDSGGDLNITKQYLNANKNVKIYCGDDEMTKDMMQVGATGLVSVASNIWPQQTKSIVKHCLSGLDFNHQTWIEICKTLFLSSNPIPAKALMFEKKMIKSKLTRPPLSQGDLSPENLKILIESDNKMKSFAADL